MPASHIQLGEIEPIQVLAVDKKGKLLTGLTDLFVRIRRDSDGFFVDFSDTTFKTEGSVVTLESVALGEISTAAAAGLYDLAGGFDVTTITGFLNDDEYAAIPVQTPGTNAVLPAPAKFRVGGFVDNLDSKISAIDAAADGSHISAAYDPGSTALAVTFWLDRNGVTVTATTGITVTWHNEDGTTLFSHTDSDSEITGPDAQGIWRLLKIQALAKDEAYYVTISITDATGTVTSTRGVPTVG